MLLILILALAAGLRFYRLEAQSLWYDEGNSARMVERNVAGILEHSARDIHPPLYYLALHLWTRALGSSEFGLRSFSAVGGIGLVALVYALGAGLFGRPAGLAAALLAAINPFQVYYSQEARAYIWVACLTAAAVLCGYRYLNAQVGAPSAGRQASAAGWAVGYVLLTAAGLYTHYIFALGLVALNLVAIIQLGRQRALGRLGRWLALNLIAGTPYLPWAPIAWRQLTTWPSAASQAGLGAMAASTFKLLSLGSTLPLADATPALLGFGFLLLAGLLPLGGRFRLLDLLLIVLWLLVPVGTILALGLYKEAFLKFMLVVSPAYCLLLGRGIGAALGGEQDGLPGRWRAPLILPVALSLGLVLSFSYDSLHNLYLDPAYARADYRGLARTIEAARRPGDAVILNAPNQVEVFGYYSPSLDHVFPLPNSRPVNKPELEADLARIAADHERVFAILWGEAESDPDRLVERWLNAHAFQTTDTWWRDVRLVTYALPAGPIGQIDIPLEARLGDAIALRGYTLPQDRLAPAEILQLALFWQALAPIDGRYKVFVQLLDGTGRLVAQRDNEPGGGFELTTAWRPGQVVNDNHGVLVPAETSPGVYALIVGLYPLDDPGTRLPVTLDGEPTGDAVWLHPITITQ